VEDLHFLTDGVHIHYYNAIFNNIFEYTHMRKND